MGSQSKGKKAITRAPSRPSIGWRKSKEGDYTPVVSFGHMVMALDPRPFHGFLHGERDAILVWAKQALSESLFGVPFLLVNSTSGKCAKNPDWDLQVYYEKHPTDIGVWVKVTPEAGAEQIAAGNSPVLDTAPPENVVSIG